MRIPPNGISFKDDLFWIKFFSACISGSLVAYFPTSFFFNFYPERYQFILLSVIFQSICIMVVYFVLGSSLKSPGFNLRNDWTSLLTLFEALCLGITTLVVLWKFPDLFNRRILFMDNALLPLFAGLSIVSAIGMVICLKTLKIKDIPVPPDSNQIFKQIRTNLPGILLALIFFFIYFVLAETINFPKHPTVDQYFDLDISAWISRLVTVKPEKVIRVRAVHPAILVFLRPCVWLASVLLHGNRLQAVFLVNALAGAACVFVFWLVAKQFAANTAYALMLTTILGASTTHLLFGAMLETYIYSALALILFVWAIQPGIRSLTRTVPMGILVFGITITNFIQTCILYFLAEPKIKTIFKYIGLCLLATVLLNALQVWIYPHTKSVLIPSNFLVEQHYQFSLTKASWQVTGHILLIIRAILLYGIVAPTPFVLTKELGVLVPHFRTFEISGGEFHVAGYTGPADIAVKLWILIIVIAGILFLLDLFKTPKEMLFPISLLVCLGFNLSLHIAYGDDPILYSADWVYALVLFVAFMFRRWADQKWLHLMLLIFLSLMMIANLTLIYKILDTSLPFYG